MERKIAVRGIVLNEGKLLCVRLKPYKGHLKRDNSYWCLPGGGLEKSESLIDGLEREMIEETGVIPGCRSALHPSICNRRCGADRILFWYNQ